MKIHLKYKVWETEEEEEEKEKQQAYKKMKCRCGEVIESTEQSRT